MPCYEVRMTKVDMAKMDKDVLIAGLLAAGMAIDVMGDAIYIGRHVYRGGELLVARGDDATEVANGIRRAYSAEVVRQTAKRMRWDLKANPKNQNAFVATKRGA